MERDTYILLIESFSASIIQVLYLPAFSVYASTRGVESWLIGVLSGGAMILYSLTAIAASPVIGRGSERGAAVISMMGLAASSLGLWAGVPTFILLGMASFALFWPAIEACTASRKSSVHAFSFSWSLGSAVGATAASLTLLVDPALLFAAMGIAAIALSLTLFTVPPGEAQPATFSGVRGLWRAWLLAFAYSTSLGGFLVYYPVFVEAISAPPAYVSLLFSSIIWSRTLAFLTLSRLKRVEEEAVHLSPLLLASGILVPYILDPYTVALLGALTGFGEAVVYTKALGEVFDRGSGYTGIFEASIGLGYAIGPLIGAPMSHTSLPAALAAPGVVASLSALVGIARGKE